MEGKRVREERGKERAKAFEEKKDIVYLALYTI